MDKMEQLKNKLYDMVKEEMPSALEDMDRIFAREIEIPVSKQYNIDSDPNWWDINDYMEEE